MATLGSYLAVDNQPGDVLDVLDVLQHHLPGPGVPDADTAIRGTRGDVLGGAVVVRHEVGDWDMGGKHMT